MTSVGCVHGAERGWVGGEGLVAASMGLGGDGGVGGEPTFEGDGDGEGDGAASEQMREVYVKYELIFANVALLRRGTTSGGE